MSDAHPEKPKIIVDDDWKSRVAAEKEQLGQGTTATDASEKSSTEKGIPERAATPRSKSEPAAQESAEDPPFPPASFSMLVSSFVTQALACLGQVPDAANQTVYRPNTAKHLIDMLGVIEEKTKGNLSPSESQMLETILHELRIAYVSISAKRKS